MSSGAHRYYNDRDLKLLWGLAAARCSICRQRLIVEATVVDRDVVVGKMGHINSHSPGGPRYDETKPAEFLRSYENLVLVCALHHDIVDGQASTFSVEELQRSKSEHELWVFSRLEQATPEIGFADLEVVCSSLLAPPELPTEPIAPTPPAEKFKKNGLTRQVFRRVSVGLAMFPEIDNFVTDVSRHDDRFPERLRAGFLKRYHEYCQRSLGGLKTQMQSRPLQWGSEKVVWEKTSLGVSNG